MAWIYLAESEDSVTPWQNGSDQLPIVKLKHTQEECSYHACFRGSCRSDQSGMMSRPCTDECCLVLTSYMAASHAKTSASQDLEKAWRESEADYFSKSYALSMKLDRNSSSWKTSQQSLLEDFQRSPQKLPKEGMIVDGALYPLRKSEPLIKEKDGGCLPTPTVYGNYNKKGASKKSGDGLATYVKMFPTPDANNQGARKNQNGHQYTLQDAVGGQLNPMWVEWLMGYPAGWTELEAWAMQWFRSKRGKRLKD